MYDYMLSQCKGVVSLVKACQISCCDITIFKIPPDSTQSCVPVCTRFGWALMSLIYDFMLLETMIYM
jgi:hypothetical protein